MIVPLGHGAIDVRQMPVTLALIIANTLVFLVTFASMSNDADRVGRRHFEARGAIRAARDAGATIERRLWQELEPTLASQTEDLVERGTSTPCDQWSAIEDGEELLELGYRDFSGRPGLRERAEDAEEKHRLCTVQTGVEDALVQYSDALESSTVRRLGYIPANPSVVSAVTSMFMHADVMHLLGNLWFLFLAGAIAERAWGSPRYLFLYLLCGFYAVIAHHAASMGDTIPMIGASGAVSALLGTCMRTHPALPMKIGYFWLFPRLFTGTMEVALGFAVGGWFVWQVALMLLGFTGGVAVWAHIGGFVLGYGSAAFFQSWGWVRTGDDDLADELAAAKERRRGRY